MAIRLTRMEKYAPLREQLEMEAEDYKWWKTREDDEFDRLYKIEAAYEKLKLDYDILEIEKGFWKDMADDHIHS